MIKNRNVDPHAAIDPSKIAGGFGHRYMVREVYHVAKANTAIWNYLNDHVASDHLFTTVTAALAVAGDYDVIHVEDGVYDEGAELVISQTGLKLIGSGTSGLEWGPCSLKQSSANHHIISVQANGVEIANLGFIVNGAYKAIEIDHTAAVYKTHIHDCFFGGNGTSTYGVYAGGTFDAVDTVIENNGFLNWATAGIYMNATRSKALNNVIFVPDSGIGIDYVPTTSDRGYNVVAGNRITGTGTSDTGIKLEGAPTKGQVMMYDNYCFAALSATITQTANGQYNAMMNYTSADSGAVTVIDTDS
jgi:hypothetical protein